MQLFNEIGPCSASLLSLALVRLGGLLEETTDVKQLCIMGHTFKSFSRTVDGVINHPFVHFLEVLCLCKRAFQFLTIVLFSSIFKSFKP